MDGPWSSLSRQQLQLTSIIPDDLICIFHVQSDGNLIVYDSNIPMFQTGPAAPNKDGNSTVQYFLVLQVRQHDLTGIEYARLKFPRF